MQFVIGKSDRGYTVVDSVTNSLVVQDDGGHWAKQRCETAAAIMNALPLVKAAFPHLHVAIEENRQIRVKDGDKTVGLIFTTRRREFPRDLSGWEAQGPHLGGRRGRAGEPVLRRKDLARLLEAIGNAFRTDNRAEREVNASTAAARRWFNVYGSEPTIAPEFVYAEQQGDPSAAVKMAKFLSEFEEHAMYCAARSAVNEMWHHFDQMLLDRE